MENQLDCLYFGCFDLYKEAYLSVKRYEKEKTEESREIADFLLDKMLSILYKLATNNKGSYNLGLLMVSVKCLQNRGLEGLSQKKKIFLECLLEVSPALSTIFRMKKKGLIEQEFFDRISEMLGFPDKLPDPVLTID